MDQAGIGHLLRDRVYGNGFINADAAVRRARALAEGAV